MIKKITFESSIELKLPSVLDERGDGVMELDLHVGIDEVPVEPVLKQELVDITDTEVTNCEGFTGKKINHVDGGEWTSVLLMSEGKENRLIIPVEFPNGSYNKAIVDTGSPRSIVGRNVVEENQLSYREVEVKQIFGIGSNSFLRVVGVATIMLSVHGQAMLPVEFYVTDGSVSAIRSIILGTDFLIKNNLSVDLCRRRISGKLPSGALWDYYIGCDDQPCVMAYRGVPCRAVSSVSVPGGKTEHVSVGWDIPNLLHIESCKGCAGDQNQFVIDESESLRTFKYTLALLTEENRKGVYWWLTMDNVAIR